jgi:hypothetical protein
LQVAGLNKEAANAREVAGNAEKEAAQANERAAKFDSDRVMVEKEADEIRSTNLVLSVELEKLKNPRTINPEQRNKFIELLKTYPKFPIKVFSFAGDNEAYRYASQIMDMLVKARYANTIDQVIEQPVNPREWTDSPYKFNQFDIGCFVYGTNRTISIIPTPGLLTLPNGAPFLTGTNSTSEFRCVIWAFDQIQIHPMAGMSDYLLKPGEFGIFIPPKNH